MRTQNVHTLIHASCVFKNIKNIPNSFIFLSIDMVFKCARHRCKCVAWDAHHITVESQVCIFILDVYFALLASFGRYHLKNMKKNLLGGIQFLWFDVSEVPLKKSVNVWICLTFIHAWKWYDAVDDEMMRSYFRSFFIRRECKPPKQFIVQKYHWLA